MGRLILLLLAIFGGIWWGYVPPKGPAPIVLNIHPEKEMPVAEHKSFVIVMYACNQALWCERSLRSVFEQDYDHYRVIFVDDGSIDGTGEVANRFIVENHQEEKVILIRNDERLGLVASLYRAIDSCLDREIVIPLDAKDWLSAPTALHRLNSAYQNPDVWIASCQAIEYPSYAIGGTALPSFYAALFKQLRLQDLYQQGRFATESDAYLLPLRQMAGGRVRSLAAPLVFHNAAAVAKPLAGPSLEIAHYEPLPSFPEAHPQTAADILIFSFDRPLQLYACLESVQRYVTGFQTVTVLYRTSTPQFAAAYEKVKDAFPAFEFVAQLPSDPKHDFKPQVQKIVFDSPSQYLLFCVDDIIMKDFVDLKFCMEQMEKTGAYGFYLRFGKHIDYCYQFARAQSIPPSHPLAGGIYAWDIQEGELDWGFANSLDMTLFRKEILCEPLAQMKYKTPNSLEFNWAAEYRPQKAIGLYFERSKLVNIPMNVVGRTGNPHMNDLSIEELLAKFNQGLKIDIEPLYKVENRSPHLDYIPAFVLR